MRKSIPFLVLALVLALLLSPALQARADQPVTLIEISTDPYTNPDSQHQTQVEPDNFAYGNTIVATFQSGRFYDGGASNVGWSTSQDGGVTWTDGFLPGTTVYASPPGAYDRVSDPAAAYDAKHGVWMVSTLAITGSTGVAVLVSRSTDGGLTWGNPVVVSSKPGGFYDKNWITCDNWPISPHYGNCYTTWDDAYQGNKFYMSTSSDGGLTWGAKKSPSGSGGLGGLPVVRPNGLVIVPAWGLSNQIIIFGSINGGNSWSRTKVVSNISQHNVAGGLRASFALPSVEADSPGRLYMVWNDCRFRSGCSSNASRLTRRTAGWITSSPVLPPPGTASWG
ncbi:MAG: exo-alpha-sialidase [Chloroflexi bacterium]|nr:exo-alpha-sialidase [Chloroflexota bacterium]